MQKVFFKNKSGLKLCGIWHLPKNKTDKAIILAHGFNVDKDELGIFVHLANRLQEDGYAVFRFDFSAHGESEGEQIDITITSEIKDLENVIDYVANNSYLKIGVLAASFGASIAPLLSQDYLNKMSALCLWNPTLNFDHVLLNPVLPYYKAKQKLWKKDLLEKGYAITGRNNFKMSQALFNEMKILKPYISLKNIKVPVMIIHSKIDTYVPYEDSKEYVKYLKNGELITIENLGHGFQEKNPGDYKTNEPILKTVEFFKKYL